MREQGKVFYVTMEDSRDTSSTSKGDQPKWFKENHWIKEDRFGYESIAEWAVYNLLLCSNIDRELLVAYDIVGISKRPGELVRGCASLDFLKPSETLLTLQRLLDSRGLVWEDDILSSRSTGGAVLAAVSFLYDVTGLDLTEYISDMLALDCFVLNEDRHTNNIAVIYDAETGLYKPCPLFDHGLSLLSDTRAFPYRNSTISNIVEVKSKPFHEDFRTQINGLPHSLRFDKRAVLRFVEQNRDILGRAGEVIMIQMDRCPYLLV